MARTTDNCKECENESDGKKEECESLDLESNLKDMQNYEQTKDFDRRDTIVNMMARLTFSP